MDVRDAISRWVGAGAVRNARASLDEWNRAQDEVAALLVRLDHRDGGQPSRPRPGSAA
jgi:hypothetical protein